MAVTPLAELQRQQRSGVKSLGALQDEQRAEIDGGFRDPVVGSYVPVQIPDRAGSKRAQLRDAMMRKFHEGQDAQEVFGPGDALSDQYWGQVLGRTEGLDEQGKLQQFYQLDLGFSPEMAVGRTDAITETLFGKPVEYKQAWGYIQDAYKTGQIQVQLADLGLEVLMGRDTAATWKEIERLRGLAATRSITAEKWWTGFASSTAEQVPLMRETIEAAPVGAIAGGVGGLAAGVALSMSPTVGEESMVPAMVWGGIKGGAGVAGAYRVGQLEAGSAVLDMLDSGVDPAVAKAAAFGVGALNGALELGQISTLVKTLPGGKKILGSLTGDVAKRLIKQRTLRDLAVSHAGKFGGYLSAETLQELAQESVTVTAEETAKLLTEQLGGQVDYATIQQIKDRMIEVGTKSLQSFTVMGIPGSTLSAAVDVAAMSRQKAAMRLLPDGRDTQIRIRVPEVETKADAAAASKPADSTGKGPANDLMQGTTDRVVSTNLGQAQQEAQRGGGPAAGTAGPARPDSGKLPGGRQAGGTILFDPDEWAQLIRKGRELVGQGATEFAAWSERMVAAAGESVRPALQAIFESATMGEMANEKGVGREDQLPPTPQRPGGTKQPWQMTPQEYDVRPVYRRNTRTIDTYEHNDVGYTFWVKGATKQTLETYGPYAWELQPENPVNVADLQEKARTELQRQLEAEELPYALDQLIRNTEGRSPEEMIDALVEEMNPPNIVDAGGAWENQDFVLWAFETLDLEGKAVETLDGLIAFNEQPATAYREHEELVKEAVTQGQRVPAEAVRPYAGEDWADAYLASFESSPRSQSAGIPSEAPAASERDSGKLPGGRQAGGTILFSPDEWIRVVKEARRLFAEGAEQFGSWSEMMVAAAGEEIRPALKQLWDLAVDPTIEPEQVAIPQGPASPASSATSAVQSVDPVQLQTALEDLSYAALAEKARDIGVRVKGKKAQLAAAVAAMIKAKTARRTVARPDAGDVHPGSLTFREFNAILGRELAVKDSAWLAKWSIPDIPEKPKDWFRRLSAEWQGLQTLGEIPEVQEPGSVRWAELDEKAQQEIEALDKAEPDDAIRRAEKEIVYAAMFTQALKEGQEIRTLRDALYAAYRAGTQEGVSRAKEAYRKMRQAIKARKEMREEIVRYLNQIKRPVGKTVAFEQRQAIERIQATIDPAFRSRKTVAEREASRKYFAEHPEAEAPAKVLDLIHRKSLGEMTVTEIEQLAQVVQELRRKGKILQSRTKTSRAEQLEEDIRDVVTSIDAAPPAGWDPEAPILRPPEESRRERWWNFYVSTLTPERVFDWLDRGKDYMGSVFRIFWTRVADAESTKLVKIRERTAATVEILKRLKLTYQDLQATALTIRGHEYTVEMCIGAYNFCRNLSSRLAITHGNGIRPSDQEQIRQYIEEQRPELKELADWILAHYEEHYGRLRQAHIDTFDEDMGREDNYSPMVRMESDYTPDERQIHNERMQRHHLAKGYAERGFTHMRKDIEPEFQQPIRLDAWSLLLEQIERQEHYIAMGALVKDLHAVLADEGVREALRRRGGKNTLKNLENYVSAVGNPGTYKTYGQTEKWLRRLRRNTAIAFLGWKLSTILKQPVSMVRYLPHAGMHLLQAGLEAASDWGRVRSLVIEKDPLVEQPALERELEELKAADAKGYQELIDKVGQAGMQGIVWMDGIARTIGWYGTYLHEIANGATEERAVERARLATSTSQAGARVFQLPELYRSNQEAFLLLTQFTNELNKLWNIATYDFPQLVKNSQWERAAGTFVAVGIEASLMWMIANRALPKDEQDGLEIVGDQLVGALPVLGPIIVSTAHGFGGQGIPAWEGAAQAAVALRETALEGLRGETDDAKILDAAHKIYKGLAPWAGVPYTGPRDIARTILNQNLGYLLGGKPPERRQSNGRRGGGRRRGSRRAGRRR